MKQFIRCWLMITLAGSFHTAHAQYVYDFRRTADVYYNAKDYYSAAQYYSKALGTFRVKPQDILPYAVNTGGGSATTEKSSKIKDYETVVYRLAESYRQYRDFGNAEVYYGQVAAFNNPTFPLARFWYGVSLRANGKYQEALDQLKQFQSDYTKADEISTRVALEIACCEFALSEAKRNARYSINKIGGNVNSGGANYAPVVMGGNTLLFTSSRPETPPGANEKDKEKKENPYVNDLFVAKGQGFTFDNSEKVSIPAIKGMDQGAAAVSPDGNTMYLTRWNTENGQKHAGIYMSIRQGGGWSEPKTVGTNVNVDGFSSMQPFVTADNKYLFFSSNRPGGMGKYDIWYSPLQNGMPGAAKNMGTGINSRDEEEAPYYDAQHGVLIFSSDGRVGLGGLDFFSSEGSIGNWSPPKNMGVPLNSSKDDIYYTPVDKENPLRGGYISSDRESVCCLELFSIKKNAKSASGQILDCDGNMPLTGATVTLLDTVQQKVLQQVTVNETGHYSFDVEMQQNYKVMAEKENYFSKAIYFNTDELTSLDSLMNPSICLKRFEVGKPIILKDIYYDYNKAVLRPQSLIVLDTVVAIMQDNPNIIIEMGSHTDSKGTDSYNIKLSQDRAQSCVDYLASKGIPTSRMVAKGYGEARPIAPNTLPNGKDNPDGRQLNRRTEFKVLRIQPQLQ
ncbi:OmpA family protein [Chitinophaga agrisoli]|uniref:OmpA family protein n=1 Tax=Chitinophaga agrisoli TaxID=2607653 RepID=A0A5B2W2Q8_9BACT|nr:OmpA family protein [Chitinophaga agrisoli]KAA2244786.1 OmpA family protein [Chitinophaga agrisoli]